MIAAAIPAKIRSVSCQHCGNPIRLSASFSKRKTAIEEDGLIYGQGLHSRVFSARCKVCNQENIDSLNQIVEFPEEGSGRNNVGY